MDKLAVIEGCYVDLKFMPGIKCARVSIDIPIEHSNAFLKMFDAPDRANPVPVAVARLATPTAKQSSSGLSRSTTTGPDNALPSVTPPSAESQGQEARRTPFKDLPRSQQAALRIGDREFQDWFVSKYFVPTGTGALDSSELGYNAHRESMEFDWLVKRALGIDSKKLLDTSEYYAEKWDKMLTSFDTRAYQR